MPLKEYFVSRTKIWNFLLSDLKSIYDLQNLKKSIKNGKLKAAHVDCAKHILKKWYFVKNMKLGLFY